MANRFAISNGNDIKDLQVASSSKNTSRSTNTWVNVFESWSKSRGINKKLYEFNPEELNKILERFYTELRKTDGDEYEPGCLKVMISALDR